MNNNAKIWIERLSSLYRSQMRKMANSAGLQLVHLEILHYLSICNRHSNTAKDISDYLGQTKGSISQSLKFIEEAGHVIRQPCVHDRRVIRLHLTPSGEKCVKHVLKDMLPEFSQDKQFANTLKTLLNDWQRQAGVNGFGQCKSCQYNHSLKDGKFHCKLLNVEIPKKETEKICKEHQF